MTFIVVLADFGAE
jgi:crotonobetainyl-CoA:carnitine CoA-transferase CaiB-like acyl-CoA transferase